MVQGLLLGVVLVSISLKDVASCLAILVLINWYLGLFVHFLCANQVTVIVCRNLHGAFKICHMEHREALVFSMHIVSTLLSRLLFLTTCIFNVNIYSIYQTVFVFPCYNTRKVEESQVSY